jgi:hypothetical protein
VENFNIVTKLLKSNNEEILGVPISDEPDPKDKSDKDKSSDFQIGKNDDKIKSMLDKSGDAG